MANNERENRMHGNPEMRGGHRDRGDGGLSQWGHPEPQGGPQGGYGNPARFDQHGGQTGQDWHSQNAGGMNQSGGAMGGSYYGDQGSQPQGGGFDRQRHGQQGLGSHGGRDHPQSWGEAQDVHPDHHDHQYRSWRDRQMQAFDREYQEFRRHRQERFNSEFDEWRKSRTGSDSAGPSAPGERISTTQRPSGSPDRDR